MKKLVVILIWITAIGSMQIQGQQLGTGNTPVWFGLNGGMTFPLSKLRHESPLYEMMFNNPSTGAWMDIPMPMILVGKHWVISAHFQLAPGETITSQRADFLPLAGQHLGEQYLISESRSALFGARESGYI
jgi:hypothetical protein